MTRRSSERWRLNVFSVLISSIFFVTPAAGAASNEASYSLTQAAEGRGLYAEHCASCHGMALLGNESGPALSGKAFQDRWASRPAEQLFAVTTTSMPSTNPGGLAARDYAAILAYMLYENGYVASTTDLDLSSQVSYSVALGYPSTGQQPSLPAASTLSNRMTEWLHHRGTPHGTNYSSLDLIHEGNVADLEVAWRWRSDNFGASPWPNYQVTPLMANGVLYATAGARRAVVAIDAATGETMWMYRLDEGERGSNAPRKGPGRGVAIHRGADRDTIFVISPGYQLIALDALTGQLRDDFGGDGIVDLKLQLGVALDPVTAPIGASSPPIVVNDVVIVGAAFTFSGAPESPEGLKGKVTAYDVNTGELRWRFNTIPTADESGFASWGGDSAEYKRYQRFLQDSQNYQEGVSTKYSNWQQLVKLGLVKAKEWM